MKRAAKWTALTLGALLVLVLATAVWSVNTQTGTRSLARIAVKALGELARLLAQQARTPAEQPDLIPPDPREGRAPARPRGHRR